ncbi:unnamed protein product, partial [Ectocarpus sp. 12 AP-2014]
PLSSADIHHIIHVHIPKHEPKYVLTVGINLPPPTHPPKINASIRTKLQIKRRCYIDFSIDTRLKNDDTHDRAAPFEATARVALPEQVWLLRHFQRLSKPKNVEKVAPRKSGLD